MKGDGAPDAPPGASHQGDFVGKGEESEIGHIQCDCIMSGKEQSRNEFHSLGQMLGEVEAVEGRYDKMSPCG
jgi:hypothetical protein